jgi:general secretion pathway protein E
LVNQKDPEQKLTLSLLCQWLAEKANLPFYVIDPLKADVPVLTAVMSQEFATRNHILAVEVNDAEVLIGTDQPFLTDWVGYLENGLKPKKIQRVF